ncbi:pYEATS domain-containing protein [Lysobacter sp. FW306-1B-D06B]|uniref:pYEATS domain-containing protein n=1 Tax=Lysobacter sp. FW306-1B-D06B TaxID=3140250 RepID=UPI0031407398
MRFRLRRLLVACSLAGFLVVYIWTRTGFILHLEKTQSDLATMIRNKDKALMDTLGFLETAAGSRTAATQIAADRSTTGRDTSRTLTERALWDSDPHKDKFGGQPKAGGFVLSAEVRALGAGASLRFGVHLTVTRDDRRPFEEVVTFYLHPTFSPDVVRVAPVNGVAELKVVASEAFTVGAEVGETRLELDLNQLPGVPSTFRY